MIITVNQFIIQGKNIWPNRFEKDEWVDLPGLYKFDDKEKAEKEVNRIKGYFNTGGKIRVTHRIIIENSFKESEIPKK